MCPEITNLTCYLGDYNQLLRVLIAGASAGIALGAMVGIIVYIIKAKL